MQWLRMLSSTLAVGAMCVPVLAQDAPPRRGGDGAPPSRERPVRDPNAPREQPPPRDPNAPREQPPPRDPNAPRGPAAGSPRAPLSPEQAKAVWELQAKQTAKTIGLNEDQTKHTVTVYVEARESYAKAMEELNRQIRDRGRGAGDAGERDPDQRPGAGGGEMRRPMAELHKTERAKLEAALAKSLAPDHVTQSLVTLGTFNPVWDFMVNALQDFKLEPAKNDAAMSAVHTYIAALGKAMASEDREATRAANQEGAKQLRETMKGILDEEQFGKFERLIPGAGRMAPRGEGPARRPGGERPPAGDGNTGGDNPPPPDRSRGRGGRGGDNP